MGSWKNWKECFVSLFANIVLVSRLHFFLILARRCNKYPLTRCKVATRDRACFSSHGSPHHQCQFYNLISFWFMQTSRSQILACIRIIWFLFKNQKHIQHPPPHCLLIHLFWCRAWRYFNHQSHQVILLQVVTVPYFKNCCPRLYTCCILVTLRVAILSVPLTVHESKRESLPWEFRRPLKATRKLRVEGERIL